MKLRKHLLTATAVAAYGLMLVASSSKTQAPKTYTFDAAPGTTGNAQSLTRVTFDPIPEFYPHISADGKRMVFHVRNDQKTGNERWSIVMMNLGTPGRIPLVGSYTNRASFFPDSKTIIY